MKHLLIVVFTLFTIYSCNSTRFESIQYNDLAKSCLHYGIDLDKGIYEFESFLIKEDILSDGSGKSYYEIFERIKVTGDINYSYKYSFLDSIKTNIDSIDIATMQFISAQKTENIVNQSKYKKSKQYRLQTELALIQEKGNIDIKEIGSIYCQILSPNDFNNNYYKLSALLLIEMTRDVENGISRTLPSKTIDKSLKQISKRNLLSIKVLENNDSILVNENNIAISDLMEYTIRYILSDSTDTSMPELRLIDIPLLGKCYQSQLGVHMQNSKKVSYSNYIQVQNEIVRAYKAVRNQKALEFFKQDYNSLQDEQRKAIRLLVPQNISEAEPLN